MKTFLSFLVSILATILGAAALSILSGNNIAVQFGGEGNSIKQTTVPPSQSAPAPATQPTAQQLSPAPSQGPSAITTQPPPGVTGGNATTQPSAAPAQTSNPLQRHAYNRRNTARYVEDCSCPADEVSEDEADDEVTADEVEECDCEEEPPAI